MPGRRLPPLTAIRAFEAAARHRSMSRAAEELAVTPGAVSRQVRALEAEMGAPLFLRRATGLEPTRAGELLAGSVGEALDRISEAVSGVRLRPSRRLTIGVYGYFASTFLLPRWGSLVASHPHLAVDLHTSVNPLDLLPGRYDAVIAVSDGGRGAGLVAHRLLPITTLPVCAPALRRDGRDFRTARLLHARPRPDDWRRWLDHAGLGTVPIQGGSSFDSMGLALQAAAAGLGHAMAIEALIGPDLDSGRLVVAHPVRRPTRRHFTLQYESRLARDPSLRDFAGWLCDEAARPSTAAPIG
jgi:LysR family glycine cleavage system transcriptional activator